MIYAYSSPWRDPTQLQKSVLGASRSIWHLLTAVDGVDGRACNKESFESIVFVDPVQAKCHVAKDSKGVFAAVDQMRKRISGIIVTSQTL